MFGFTKKLLAMVPIAALLFVVSPVGAYSVEYYTVGYFTISGASANGGYNLPTTGTPTGTATLGNTTSVPSGGPYTGSSSLMYSNPSAFGGLATLTYVFSGDSTINNFPGSVTNPNFGYFTATDTNGILGFDGLAANDNVGFTLDIYEKQPTVSGPGVIVDTLVGSIASTGGSGNLKLTFSPNNVWIPDPATGLNYTVASPTNIISPGGGNQPLMGSIAAPLPNTALAGIFLIGCVGCVFGFKLLRSRQ